MSVTTPLTVRADEDASLAADAVADLTTRLAELDRDLKTIRETATTATATLATVAAEELRIRRELGKAPLPADADQLVSELEANLIQRRHASADAASSADTLTAAERTRATVAAALVAAQAELAAATTSKKEAQAEADRGEAWRLTVLAQPMADLLTAADQALGAAPYTEARERLVTTLDGGAPPLPIELFASRATEAEHRDAELTDRLDRARKAGWAFRTARGDPLGDVLAARHGYDTAVAALSALAEQAESRYEWAIGRLTAILGEQPPTEVEQGRMDSLRTAAEPAMAKEQAVYEAADTVREKRGDLDQAVLDHIPDDPAIDPETSDAVAAERQAVADAQQALEAAEGELAGVQDALDQWETAIPNQVKGWIIDFLSAEATLKDLSDARPDRLVAEVADATQPLADAQLAARKAAEASARLRSEVAARAGDAEARDAVAMARRAALIIGEG